MANFYRDVCGSQPCDFQVFVSSVHPLRNLPYCTSASRCRIDPNQKIGPGPFTESLSTGLNGTTHWSANRTALHQYRTASGRYIIAPGGQRPNMGQSTFRVQAKNGTLWKEHMAENRESDDTVLENLETVEDVIVGLA